MLDASVTLAWCRKEEATPAIDQLFLDLHTGEAVVPHVWPLEVGNALEMAVRRNRISAIYLDECLSVLRRLPIRIEPVLREHDWGILLGLARRHRLTVYDASYLALSVERTLPLATLDEELISAARTEGVALLP